VQVRSRETPGSLVVEPPASGEILASKRGRATDRSAACAKPEQASTNATIERWPRGCRTCSAMVKAMDGVPVPGGGAQEPSGVVGVERSEGCHRNWGDPPRPRRCGRREASLPITGEPWEVAGGREGVGGGRSSDDGRDNTTRSERRTPTSPMQERGERDPDECRGFG